MVNFCAVLKCGIQSSWDKDTRFFCLPSVIIQGEKTKDLSEMKRPTAICRQDIKPHNYPHTHVCHHNFVSGEPSKL